jgi:hypothetical protein
MKITDEMVSRFLGWRLPDDFMPDGGVTFKPLPHGWPTGTNLLHAGQARAMLEHVLAASTASGPRNAERQTYASPAFGAPYTGENSIPPDQAYTPEFWAKIAPTPDGVAELMASPARFAEAVQYVPVEKEDGTVTTQPRGFKPEEIELLLRAIIARHGDDLLIDIPSLSVYQHDLLSAYDKRLEIETREFEGKVTARAVPR